MYCKASHLCLEHFLHLACPAPQASCTPSHEATAVAAASRMRPMSKSLHLLCYVQGSLASSTLLFKCSNVARLYHKLWCVHPILSCLPILDKVPKEKPLVSLFSTACSAGCKYVWCKHMSVPLTDFQFLLHVCPQCLVLHKCSVNIRGRN